MLSLQKTTNSNTKSFLMKVALILVIIIGVIAMLVRIDFPSPNKEIKKIIPNAKIKIVK